MERTRSTKNGRFDNDSSPHDILEVMEPDEIYSTSALADKTDIAQRTTRKYLDTLAEQGRVEKQKPNATTAIWIRRD
ncbi:hypothetical protein ACFQDG_01185 [Natronoarchaeum mannanilyticum]